jgi:glycosyltransferase involved in cell wall biosynthesis
MAWNKTESWRYDVPIAGRDRHHMRHSTTRYGLYLSDLNRDKNDSHGIINYAIGLANALPGALDDDEDLVIYANPAIARELRAMTSEQVAIELTPPPTPVRRLMSDHVLGVRRAARDDVSVLHFPKGFLPLAAPPRMRLMATLHDDIPLLYARGEFGKQYASIKSKYFTHSLRHTLRLADGLVTVSDTSLSRFMMLAKETDITMPLSFVSHQGITLPVDAPVPVEAKQPMLLHIGSSKPHKRSYEAVQFMLEYARTANQELRLAILGPLNRNAELLLRDRQASRIKRTLSTQELARLIRESRALVFNSEREGFGLPPVEAYALGTPAVYARTDVMVEVLGDTPGAFSQGSYEEFARALDHVLALDSDDLARLRKEMLGRYDWDAVARETVKAYRQVARQR